MTTDTPIKCLECSGQCPSCGFDIDGLRNLYEVENARADKAIEHAANIEMDAHAIAREYKELGDKFIALQEEAALLREVAEAAENDTPRSGQDCIYLPTHESAEKLNKAIAAYRKAYPKEIAA